VPLMRSLLGSPSHGPHLLGDEEQANTGNSMSDEIVKAKIRRALLSGPDSITREATAPRKWMLKER
jgi:hypothetical protein